MCVDYNNSGRDALQFRKCSCLLYQSMTKSECGKVKHWYIYIMYIFDELEKISNTDFQNLTFVKDHFVASVPKGLWQVSTSLWRDVTYKQLKACVVCLFQIITVDERALINDLNK